MNWRGDRQADRLFSSQDGHATQRALIDGIGHEVEQLSEDRILRTEPEALVRYFVEKLTLEIPTLDAENIVVSERECTIESYDRFTRNSYNVAGVAYDVEVPFSGSRDIFRIQPNQYTLSPPHAEISANAVRFSVKGQNLSAEQVQQSIRSTVREIEQYLEWHRSFWSQFGAAVANKARDEITKRRARLEQQRSVSTKLAGMGFKLKEKPNDPRSYIPPAIKQRIQPQLPPMKAAPAPDPALDRNQYETILGLVRGAGQSIEQSSSRTRNLGEEALRDMLLVPLNAHFGSATGEAFNATGKTDILIRQQGGNIFVAECKFWGGEKQFLETISQLLGYLTWRDTKTAVIIFNRNQGFSAVAKQVTELPKQHAMFVSGPRRLDETSVEYTLSLPNDRDRHITLTAMAFDLGPKTA